MEKKSYTLFFRALGIVFLSICMVFPVMTGCKKPPVDPTPEPDEPEQTWLSRLLFMPDTVFFNGNETKTLFMTLRDSCAPTEGEYYIIYPYEWLDVHPTSGVIRKGDIVRLELTAHLDSVLFEPYIDELYAELEYFYDPAAVAVATLVYQPIDQLLYSFPDTMYFPHGHDDVFFAIKNEGNVDFEASITPSSNAVNLSESTITVQVGEQKEVSIHIDRESLMHENNPFLNVTIGGQTKTVSLMIEKKQMLPNEVIDAEYSKAMDFLVYVAADVTLNIYHPDTKAIDVVQLPYYPNCVSVSADGTKAVVGHESYVSCVDLQTKTVISTNEISCDAFDIVLGNNGWAYAFPRRDQWCHIHCVDMATSGQTEVQHTGNLIRSGTHAKMHPSGKYIYGADYSISPNRIEKYDIQNDTASHIYDKGGYNYKNLWITENGDRLVTTGGEVMKLSEIQSEDIVLVGKLQFEGSPTTVFSHIECLDHSEASGRFFALSQTNQANFGVRPILPYVYVHDATNLAYLNKIRLEDYMILNSDAQPSIYTVEPFFVFANSGGNEIYVLTKSIDSGLVNDWAVQTVRIY